MIPLNSCVNTSTSKIEVKIKEAYTRDQGPRVILDSLIRAGETDGDILLPLIEQMKYNDSINREIIFPIIDRIIEKQLYDIDSSCFNTCWLVIQHAGIDNIMKYDAFVRDIAGRGLISKNSYMAFVDRQQVYMGKKQLYGIQLHRFPGGEIVQYPIDNNVQRNWNELGLTYDLSTAIPFDRIQLARPTCVLEDSEYAILGAIYDEPESLIPLADVKVYLDSEYVTSSDSSGLFSIIAKKDSTIPILSYFLNGENIVLPLEFDSAKDFFVVEHCVSNICKDTNNN